MTDTDHFEIEWKDTGREAQNPPNPLYPDGVDVKMSKPGKRHCTVEVPYPAERIGFYIIVCTRCGTRVGCTTAGRADDPRSVTITCGEERLGDVKPTK